MIGNNCVRKNDSGKRHFAKRRWLAFILCLTLCIESSSLNVLAAENEDTAEETCSDCGINDDNTAPADWTDEVNGSDSAGNTETADQADEEGDADITDNTDAADQTGEESDVSDAENNDSIQEQISANDTQTVSDNDIVSVSDNDVDSVSGNDLDAERQAMIREATEAFDNLLADKNLMALLYHTDSYSARRKADEDSGVTASLAIGQTLYIRGVAITEEDVWYEVQFWQSGVEGTGYVQSYYLAYSDEDWIAWEENYLIPILESGENYGLSAYGMSSYSIRPYAIDTSDIAAFPGSYQSALRSLKSEHPNWTFVPMNTRLDFNTSVSSEMGDKSLIQNTTSNASKGWVGAACPSESGWYYATKPAVAYYMDPRNFLTETYIFQFEQLTFNSSYHTESAVQTFLDGTFMWGKLADDAAGRTYARAFYEIGKGRKLSPIHLASRVYQEQGQGNSGLISGTYPGYEGYYNFFNVGVNGSSTEEKIKKGLTYAKEKGWNTRYKSLEGGAATIGNNYILKYQDTIYLEKFNVDTNSPYGVYNHQYMQNIQAPASESSSTRKMYANAGSLSSAFVFKIPVFTNMPDSEYYPTLSLNKTSMVLDRNSEKDCEEGQQLKLYADGIEVNASEAEWKSSDITVATVENGQVRAVDAGETIIMASYADVEITCKVTVKISLLGITLDKTEIRLRRPDTVVEDVSGLSDEEKAENIATATLQVSFDPADTTADRTIQWSSSNIKIAKVKADPEDNSKAVVTAVGSGEVTITAKAAKAGNKTAVCKVSVSAPIYRIELTNPNAIDLVQPDKPAASTTLLRGQSVNLAAEYWPKDTTSDTRIVWSTSNPKTATVKNGRVEAVGEDAKEKAAVITAWVAGCEQGYTAQHTVIVEDCAVVFMKRVPSDGKAVLGTSDAANEQGASGISYTYDVLKKQSVRYGDTLDKEDFPKAEEVSGSLFIGWYTGEDGTGSRFDETTVIHGKQTILYPHYEEQGKGLYVLPVGDQTYTGSAIKPVVHVYDSVTHKDGSVELIELALSKDYTVTYKNNKKVNKEGGAVPTITIKGKGNYAKTAYAYFNILPKPLTDTDITADNIAVAYSGKVIKSAPAVYRNGKKLVKGTDYTVTYPQTGTGAYRTAGTYPIVITGKGGYEGSITVHEIITQEVLMSKVTIAKIPNQPYRNESVDKEKGKGIEPESLRATYKGVELNESRDDGLTGDYTVSYSNNMAIGTATATITAVEGSGYTGSKSITYKIVGTSIAKAKVEGLTSKEYTGSEADVKQDAYTLILDDNVLTESTDGGLTGDYVVSYTNISKAGTASIVFKGVNEYSGQIKKTYKITAYDISPDELGRNDAIHMQYYTQDAPEQIKTFASLSENKVPYVKGGSKPVVVLSFNGITLTQGKDYAVKYANNNPTTPTDPKEQELKKLPKITVTGKGSFKGSITVYYMITDGQMAQDQDKDSRKITMTAKDAVYKNKAGAYKATVALTDCNGAKLAVGKDYDKNLLYTYEQDTELVDSDGGVIFRKAGDPVDAGDIPAAGTVIRVTARGIGMYAGDGKDPAEISAAYRIVAADISKAKVKVQAQVYQNGQPITLTAEDIVITMSGSAEPLVCGVDYKIDTDTYANNRNKGKASVVIRGADNYGGEKKITYTIGSRALVWWKNLFQ